MAKKILVIHSAKNNSPFYTHSTELYNRKWRDLSAISRKAAFEKQVLFSQMWFQYSYTGSQQVHMDVQETTPLHPQTTDMCVTAS